MWTRTYSKTFQGLKREDIWRIWTNISNWPTWHVGLDYCKLDGDFKVGNHFVLKPKGVKPVKILLTEINEGYSFIDFTLFFGAKMYDTHTMEETGDRLKLTNKLVVTGSLKCIWIKLVTQNVADTIPEETANLVKLVRSLHG